MKRVVITGGSSGIGLETVRLFGNAGFHVVVVGRSDAKLREAEESLGGNGSYEFVSADVTDPVSVNGLFQTPADVTIANAGVCLQARLDEAHSDSVWKQTMDVNVNGVYHVLKAASLNMPDGGAMVTVSSGLGKNARAGYEAYCASKHAVLGITKCVALELAPRNIRVNAVCPGWVDTPMSRGDCVATAERQGVDVDLFRAKAVAGIPLSKMVMPLDVAHLIQWLCSDQASAITGQSYNISCGEFFN
jgi:NAD(P)-dependent dehydrogenase (short-subunit alcohol dehydrogenase family)